jgi:SAM-dependent methyltransferase
VNLKGTRPERFGRVASFFYVRWGEPWLAPIHKRIAAEIPIRSGMLLDVGCGPGALSRRIAASRPHLSVLGIDESEAMIAAAHRGGKPANLDFRVCPAQQWRERGVADFALSVLSFHHWEEPIAALEGVFRALRLGAKFWIYEPDPEASDEDLREAFAPFWGWLRLPPAWLRRGFRSHGFTRREADTVVAAAVAKTSFRTLDVETDGAMLRFVLARAAEITQSD